MIEGNLNERWPKWKTHSMEDKLYRRKTLQMTNSIKTTLLKKNLKIKEINLNELKTSIKENIDKR